MCLCRRIHKPGRWRIVAQSSYLHVTKERDASGNAVVRVAVEKVLVPQQGQPVSHPRLPSWMVVGGGSGSKATGSCSAAVATAACHGNSRWRGAVYRYGEELDRVS